TVRSRHENPALSFDTTPQRKPPSKGFHGGTPRKVRKQEAPWGTGPCLWCCRVADGAGTPGLLTNRFGKLAASSIHYQSPERMFMSGGRPVTRYSARPSKTAAPSFNATRRPARGHAPRQGAREPRCTTHGAPGRETTRRGGALHTHGRARRARSRKRGAGNLRPARLRS